jgi:hypothetical protein
MAKLTKRLLESDGWHLFFDVDPDQSEIEAACKSEGIEFSGAYETISGLTHIPVIAAGAAAICQQTKDTEVIIPRLDKTGELKVRNLRVT